MLRWSRHSSKYVKYITYETVQDGVTYTIRPWWGKQQWLIVKSLKREKRYVCDDLKSAKAKAESIAAENSVCHLFN